MKFFKWFIAANLISNPINFNERDINNKLTALIFQIMEYYWQVQVMIKQ